MGKLSPEDRDRIAELEAKAKGQDEVAEAYRRKGDDYNAADSEKDARNLRAHAAFIRNGGQPPAEEDFGEYSDLLRGGKTP
jgi:hypothetical protein